MNNMFEWDHGKYCNNVVFRRKFSKELLSLNHVVFLKKICSDWQYMTMKSSKMLLNQIWITPTWLLLQSLLSTWYSHHVFILDYFLGYLEPCLYWENWKIHCLNHVVFSEKIENRTSGFEAHVVFFMTLVVNGNMFQ